MVGELCVAAHFGNRFQIRSLGPRNLTCLFGHRPSDTAEKTKRSQPNSQPIESWQRS
jgi:hypothetical protein